MFCKKCGKEMYGPRLIGQYRMRYYCACGYAADMPSNDAPEIIKKLIEERR